MEYRQLGQTDISVSVIAMGLWTIAGGSMWGAQDEADSISAIHAALDSGINFFDTAEAYGSGYSEEVLGKALSGRREEAIIATKVSSGAAADAVRKACEGSLRRLQTDYIDLYQIHWPSRDVPFEETLGALQALRDEGKIRVIGVSNFGVGDQAAMLEIGRYESNQLPYSLLWRAIEHGLQQQCVQHNISILPYSPLQHGLLAGKFATADDVPVGRARTRHFSTDRAQARHGGPGYETETFAALDAIRQISQEIDTPMVQVAVAWLLRQPGVTSVLAGARNPSQVRENAETASVELSQDVVDRLSQATGDLKTKLGPDPDMWNQPAESRFR